MIRLCTHGFPKSGNHALVKACQLLGVPCEVEHRAFADGLPPGTTHDVFIYRDPRNIIVSKLREDGQPVTPGMFVQKFRRFRDASLKAELAAYQPWRQHAGWRVRYEALVASATTMEGIALYLGVPYLPGAWQELPGLTRTWTGQPSDYRTIWTPEVEQAWAHEGGPELLAAWGYP